VRVHECAWRRSLVDDGTPRMRSADIALALDVR
jgi:hypothetical protein